MRAGIFDISFTTVFSVSTCPSSQKCLMNEWMQILTQPVKVANLYWNPSLLVLLLFLLMGIYHGERIKFIFRLGFS